MIPNENELCAQVQCPVSNFYMRNDLYFLEKDMFHKPNWKNKIKYGFINLIRNIQFRNPFTLS